MSTEASAYPLPQDQARPHERTMGEIGMWLFIATEATLFALLFFAYVYLGLSHAHWPPVKDPDWKFALIATGIMLVSIAPTWWGLRRIAEGDTLQLKIALGLVLLAGAGYIVVEIFGYRHMFNSMHPRDSSYASIFITITGLHFFHVIVGWFMVWYLLARALAGHFTAERHLAVRNVLLYWYFLIVVLCCVVSVLYISPHFYGPPLP